MNLILDCCTRISKWVAVVRRVEAKVQELLLSLNILWLDGKDAMNRRRSMIQADSCLDVQTRKYHNARAVQLAPKATTYVISCLAGRLAHRETGNKLLVVFWLNSTSCHGVKPPAVHSVEINYNINNCHGVKPPAVQSEIIIGVACQMPIQ